MPIVQTIHSRLVVVTGGGVVGWGARLSRPRFPLSSDLANVFAKVLRVSPLAQRFECRLELTLSHTHTGLALKDFGDSVVEICPRFKQTVAPKGRRYYKKKASFCNEALKGSLNLKVSKGPEETTGVGEIRRIFNPMRRLSQGFPLVVRVAAPKRDSVDLSLLSGLLGCVCCGRCNSIEVSFSNIGGLLHSFLN